jgi:hypothetical protein
LRHFIEPKAESLNPSKTLEPSEDAMTVTTSAEATRTIDRTPEAAPQRSRFQRFLAVLLRSLSALAV